MDNWWLAASSHQHACSCTMSRAEIFGETSNYPGDSIPYSADLTPWDFWLFLELKSPLKGKRFQTVDEIQENMTWLVIPTKDFAECFEQWKRCWENYVRSQDASFEGDWGIIVLCTMFFVSCIFFNKCLYFSYYMAGYLLVRPCMYHTSSKSLFHCGFIKLNGFYLPCFIYHEAWRWYWNFINCQTVISPSKPLLFIIQAKSFLFLMLLPLDVIAFLGVKQVCSLLVFLLASVFLCYVFNSPSWVTSGFMAFNNILHWLQSFLISFTSIIIILTAEIYIHEHTYDITMLYQGPTSRILSSILF